MENREQLEEQQDRLFAYGLHLADLAERMYSESARLFENGYYYSSLLAYKLAQRTHLRSVELMELSIT